MAEFHTRRLDHTSFPYVCCDRELRQGQPVRPGGSSGVIVASASPLTALARSPTCCHRPSVRRYAPRGSSHRRVQGGSLSTGEELVVEAGNISAGRANLGRVGPRTACEWKRRPAGGRALSKWTSCVSASRGVSSCELCERNSLRSHGGCHRPRVRCGAGTLRVVGPRLQLSQ